MERGTEVGEEIILSIIIPVYKVEKYIEKCLDSILCDMDPRVEVLMIDDHTPDDSIRICKRMIEPFSNVKIIERKINGGLSAARNTGIDHARGKYCWFIDSDDHLMDHALSKALDMLQNRNADLFMFDHIRVNESGEILYRTESPSIEYRLSSLNDRAEMIARYLKNEFGFEVWRKIFSLEIIKKNKIYFEPEREIFAEDICFFLYYINYCRSIFVQKECYYCYLIRSDSIMGSKKEPKLTEMIKLGFKVYDYRGAWSIRIYSDLILFRLLELEIGLQPDILTKLPLDGLTLDERVYLENTLDHGLRNVGICFKIYGIKWGLRQFICSRIVLEEFRNKKNISRIYKWLYRKIETINRERIQILIKLLSPKRKILLCNTPIHANLGDHAIAVAEKKFIEDHFRQFVFIEIDEKICMTKWFVLYSRFISKHDMIFLQGGGFMGGLWPRHEICMNRVILSCPQTVKIIFPQTCYLVDMDDGYVDRYKRTYEHSKKLYFFAREKKSFDQISNKVFPADKCWLMPDIALYLRYACETKRDGIALCLRYDKESSLSEVQKEMIQDTASETGKKVYKMDTLFGRYVGPYEREKILKQKLDEISRLEVLITDRLHGMIFAAITGTPCVVLDNISSKVSGVYQWIAGLGYIRLTRPVDISKEMLMQMMEMQDVRRPRDLLQKEFDRSAKIIKKIYIDR